MAKRARRRVKSFWQRHRILTFVLLGIILVIGVIVMGLTASQLMTDWRQAHLQPFYNTAGLPTAGPLGQVVRSEPLDVKLTNGTAKRILYRTQRADGSLAFSSGMVFIPNGQVTSPRPVVAWAHGTLGLGDQCAPSRTANPVANIAWVNTMLQNGWIVTATDYAGFGTPGVSGYLVGGDEAHDVLNSVRAARQVVGAAASDRFVIWGHSQGGNSALFSAQAAASYTPELHLVGTVASAPAAELIPLLNEQYGGAIDWVIGPLISVSWPAANTQLNPNSILTKLGRDNYRAIASQCILPATVAGLIRTALHQKFYVTNPVTQPAWRAMAAAQSAPILSNNQSLLVVESETDQVVLPNTTALYIQTACRASANLDTLWLDHISHQQIPNQSATQVISWLGDRLAGKPLTSTCNQPLPVKPAANSG